MLLFFLNRSCNFGYGPLDLNPTGRFWLSIQIELLPIIVFLSSIFVILPDILNFLYQLFAGVWGGLGGGSTGCC